jgi:hypothetical protein
MSRLTSQKCITTESTVRVKDDSYDDFESYKLRTKTITESFQILAVENRL